jgi:D-alanine-D-alanine ligase
VFNPTEVGCVEELWNEYKKYKEKSGYNFLVYREEDGSILGFTCYGPHALTLGTYDLYWIAVNPAMRGRGIGRALLSHVEAEIQARGGRMILIETSDTQPYTDARHFYERNGYHSEALIRDFYAPGDSLVFFAKSLVKVPIS